MDKGTTLWTSVSSGKEMHNDKEFTGQLFHTEPQGAVFIK